MHSFVLPILMYHRVGPEPAGPAITDALTVPAPLFTAQMEWLRRSGFHAVTQGQIYAALETGAPLPPRPVAITFDDGYRDVLLNAAPVLRRLGMPATAYVITDRVDAGDPSFLTWPELRRLEALGFGIGSHTVHHLPLTQLSSADALYELESSRQALERHLGHPVLSLAYPHGAFDARIERLVRQAGYLLAVTSTPGSIQVDPLALHRFEVLDATGLAGLKALLG